MISAREAILVHLFNQGCRKAFRRVSAWQSPCRHLSNEREMNAFMPSTFRRACSSSSRSKKLRRVTLCFRIFLLASSGWGKRKVKLTTLPRISYTSCVNLTQLHSHFVFGAHGCWKSFKCFWRPRAWCTLTYRCLDLSSTTCFYCSERIVLVLLRPLRQHSLLKFDLFVLLICPGSRAPAL